MFADTTTGFELKVDGSGYRQHTRFAKFVNLPELSRILQQVVDIRNEKDLDLPLPRLAGGGPIIVGVEPSGAQQEYTKLLADRADNIKKGSVKASEDNMLLVTSDGRKAALDIRLVMPDKPEDPDSKINQAVERIYRYWERTHANRGTQTLFLDLSTPKGTGTQSTRAARQSPEYDEAEAA
jgi:hypothetical protein